MGKNRCFANITVHASRTCVLSGVSAVKSIEVCIEVSAPQLSLWVPLASLETEVPATPPGGEKVLSAYRY
jgi:hypothetical protein